MAKTTARLRDSISALSAIRFDHAQILDGRVTNPAAAAIVLQAVQAHVCTLVACLPRPTPARVQPTGIDTAGMTDAELYAYYKRIALAEDLRFLLQTRMSDALRDRAEAIASPRAGDLASLRAAWRAERLAEERAAGIPGIGTAEWHSQYVDTRAVEVDLPSASDGAANALPAEVLA